MEFLKYLSSFPVNILPSVAHLIHCKSCATQLCTQRVLNNINSQFATEGIVNLGGLPPSHCGSLAISLKCYPEIGYTSEQKNLCC